MLGASSFRNEMKRENGRFAKPRDFRRNFKILNVNLGFAGRSDQALLAKTVY